MIMRFYLGEVGSNKNPYGIKDHWNTQSRLYVISPHLFFVSFRLYVTHQRAYNTVSGSIINPVHP